MCGIVGFTGKQAAAEPLLKGLSALEYRGYDSAGIAIGSDDRIRVVKTSGRVSDLAERLKKECEISGNVGIGHTRWATHGKPDTKNAHPHLSADGRFAVVHNGIIENYLSLRAELEADGVSFVSDTDTEVIPNLISKYYRGDPLSAVQKAVARLEGSFALAVLCRDTPDSIIAVKHFSPLLVGIGEDFNLLASDLSALLPHTRQVIYPEDGELVLLTESEASFFTAEGHPISKPPQRVEGHMQAAEKSGFEHFMLKEIYEQPEAIRRVLSHYLKNGRVTFDGLDPKRLLKVREVCFAACGSAHHAGLVGRRLIEELTGLPCRNEIASEFRYSTPVIDKNTLVVVISQSGETADTLAALKEAKKRGCYALAVVNAEQSAIAKDSDGVIYTRAGTEVAVATTKGYLTQLCCLTLFALYLAEQRGLGDSEVCRSIIRALPSLPDHLEALLKETEGPKLLAKRCAAAQSIFFMGRGIDYSVAQESSLKLKEISYLHSEAYAAGELKHGTISLISEGTPIITLAGSGRLRQKLIGNVKEVKARGGFVAVLGQKDEELSAVCDLLIPLPDLHPLLSPMGQIIPLQLFAYYVALLRGCDIDKPRNLAKSVTVE